jgi:hypothetical protein
MGKFYYRIKPVTPIVPEESSGFLGTAGKSLVGQTGSSLFGTMEGFGTGLEVKGQEIQKQATQPSEYPYFKNTEVGSKIKSFFMNIVINI